MAINPTNDNKNILEDQSSISGNVLTNDVTSPNTTGDLVIKPGSLESATGTADNDGVIQGKYGTLTLNSDGTYVYTLTKDMNYLGAGVDLHDEIFTYTVEWHNSTGGDEDQDMELKIDIHGENDKPVIKDVCVSVYEGLTGDTNVLSALGSGVNVVADNVDFIGKLAIEDQDAATAGLQADGDTGDTHKLVIDESTIKITSDDLTDAQLAAIKATINATITGTASVVEGAVAAADFGEYTVDGDFDALSVGDEACVTFEYYVEDTSTAGEVTASDRKTVSVKVLGTNDAVTINDDDILNYHDLIDGDLYKSILANDVHAAADIDVNDKLTVTDTIRTDLQFVNDGGQICVDNAAQSMRYQPGTGDIIAKDHFEFTYAASDGYTDPIGTAAVTVAMKNRGDDAVDGNTDDGDVDFYQFGKATDDSLVGSAKSDMLSGGNGNDTLNGGAGHDILYGGAGQDCITAGAGNDIVIGGKGNDSMCDDLGSDKYVFAKGDGCDTITDQNEEFITDSHGHMISNPYYSENTDEVHFDASVTTADLGKMAFFKDGDDLLIKYTDDCDVIRVKDQAHDHYGIEKITSHNDADTVAAGTQDEMDLTAASFTIDGVAGKTLDELLQYISTYDIDGSTAGVQTATTIDQVQDNNVLVAAIASGWA